MKRTTSLVILVVLMVVAVGCENDPVTIGTQGDIQKLSADKDLSDLEFLELLDSLEYEEFAGSIRPGVGAWLPVEMATWPKDCIFSIFVPSDALPDDDDNPVEFSMRIPTYQSYMDHAEDDLPLIIRLEPSDINFHAPVTVGATYMPWVEINTSANLKYFTIAPEYDEFGSPTVYWDENRLRIMFQAPHFSTWGISGGGERKPR